MQKRYSQCGTTALHLRITIFSITSRTVIFLIWRISPSKNSWEHPDI